MESDYAKNGAWDTDGNILVSGNFRHKTDFDPGPITEEYVSNGVYDAFLSKFPPDGNW